jgi:hypothetical protein
VDARTTENQKLFDWKRSGSYAWKACFPLTRTGARPAATARTAEQKPLAPEGPPPAVPQSGKP